MWTSECIADLILVRVNLALPRLSRVVLPIERDCRTLPVGASTRIMSYDHILMEEKETLCFIPGELAELLDSWLPLMRLPRPLLEVLRYERTGMPPDDERRRGVTSLE